MDSSHIVGRSEELNLLKSWDKNSSHITIIHGRRRVGKTRLIHEAIGNFRSFFFEGLEAQKTRAQQRHFIAELYRQTGNELHRMLQPGSWRDLLIALSASLGKEPVVVCLDEVQWTAAFRNEFVSELKYVWDNYFLRNNNVHLILCGSVSSFLVGRVVHSKALFGRVHSVLHLQPLRFSDVRKGYFPTLSPISALHFYLSLGGVPLYLNMCDSKKAPQQALLELCASQGSPLLHEPETLFISHFGKKTIYRKIIQYLSSISSAHRAQIAKACGVSLGGGLSKYLDELILAGFVTRVERIGSSSRTRVSRNTRYRLGDPFLSFFNTFIARHLKKIEAGTFSATVPHIFPEHLFYQWAGLAFERFCLVHTDLIATLLGFGAVSYECGSYVERGTKGKAGLQIDLLFQRKDRVLTVCEIKYKQALGPEIIEEVKNKISLLPPTMKAVAEPVLISALPPQKEVYEQRYFSRILTMDDLCC